MSWMAIEGLGRADIFSRLNLRPTGITGDFLKGDIAVQETPKGWILITFLRLMHPLTSERVLKEFSSSCRILLCRIEEHVNFSSAEVWQHGARLWAIEHEGDSDVPDLKVIGSPPANYATLERDGQKSQALDPDVDHLFEVPLFLAASITGFKHDELPMSEFEFLDWQKPKARWQFWK